MISIELWWLFSKLGEKAVFRSLAIKTHTKQNCVYFTVDGSWKKKDLQYAIHFYLSSYLSLHILLWVNDTMDWLTLLVYTRGQECMGCQSEGAEVSAKECLGL